MHLSVDLADRRVLVIGSVRASRRVLARYRAEGARVERWDAGEPLLAELSAAARGLRPRVAVVAWVTGSAAYRARTTDTLEKSGGWLVDAAPAAERAVGHVSIVGGGPGDARLMTVAAREALAEADVVLYDRLGPHDDLAGWAPGAELIDVGKTPGHHAVPQHEIEALIVERARRGLDVVRLKGGDPFVFGRGGEEVRACREAGVVSTVIPGVTSAISVPAAAGIPVTHREVSRAFTVVSGHAPFSDEELTHLAGLGGTIVVLMGVNTLPHLTAGLQRVGMRADMPLAIVERGWSHSQRTTVSTVGGAIGLLAELAPRSPAVIVIGEVVRQAVCDDRTTTAIIADAVDSLGF